MRFWYYRTKLNILVIFTLSSVSTCPCCKTLNSSILFKFILLHFLLFPLPLNCYVTLSVISTAVSSLPLLPYGLNCITLLESPTSAILNAWTYHFSSSVSLSCISVSILNIIYFLIAFPILCLRGLPFVLGIFFLCTRYFSFIPASISVF